jgi:hypothetical protein
MEITNFGQNVLVHPQQTYTPRSEQEVVEILNRHRGQRIRCVGRLHSWSRILEADAVLLDLRYLANVQCDAEPGSPKVHVGAGCQIKDLLATLENHSGWTLPSVGFITEQTIAGAISTGTHGSGRNSLSHYVDHIRVARYHLESGQAVIETIRGGDALLAARCSLGCLGVILSVTMNCRPQYNVEETFREYPNLADVLAAETKFPLQQFFWVPWRWTFFSQDRRESSTGPSRSLAAYQWYRFLVFDLAMNLLVLTSIRFVKRFGWIRWLFRSLIPLFVIRNWSVVGPSTQQLVMEHERFRHVELELFVQRDRLNEALEFVKNVLQAAGERRTSPNASFASQLALAQCTTAMEELRNAYCHHYPICIRRILIDDTAISMASPGSTARKPPGSTARNPPQEPDTNELDACWYSITLTNYHTGTARQPFFQLADLLTVSMARLFEARPHWGKLCSLDPSELRSLYPMFDAFQRECDRVDPDGLFRNPWIDSLFRAVKPGPS